MAERHHRNGSSAVGGRDRAPVITDETPARLQRQKAKMLAAGNPAQTPYLASCRKSAVLEDWVVVCAVPCEPVSTEYFPVIREFNREVRDFSALRGIFYIVETAVPQRFFTKFPKKINRVKLSDNRDRNRVNSEIQSGYQKRPFLTHSSRWRRRHARRRRTACDRRDRQRDARSCECPPGFESSASAGLELAAVSADEIFLAGRTAIAVAVKRHTPKRSKEVTRNFNQTIGKHW